MIEAGGSDSEFPKIRLPAKLEDVHLTKADWDYRSVPQKYVSQELRNKVQPLLGSLTSNKYRDIAKNNFSNCFLIQQSLK